MTMIQSLPRDEEGFIIVPVGSVDAEGNVYPGATSESYLNSAFVDFVDKTVPLSDADFQSLLAVSSEKWKLNWQAFRADGLV